MWVVIKERCLKKLLAYIWTEGNAEGLFMHVFWEVVVGVSLLTFLRTHRPSESIRFLLTQRSLVCTHSDSRKSLFWSRGHLCLPDVFLTSSPRTLFWWWSQEWTGMKLNQSSLYLQRWFSPRGSFTSWKEPECASYCRQRFQAVL